MKNQKKHLQLINSTLKLHSQMYLQTFIIYLFIFASGLFIGITLNFSMRNIPFHSQISQFSLVFSSPPSSASEFTANISTKIVTKTAPRDCTKLPKTMHITPDGMQNNTRIVSSRYPNRIEDMQDISDNKLISRALRVDRRNKKNSMVPKVAFLFLTRGNLHLAPFWDMFFKGNEGFYSIYVHTQPFFNGTFTENSVFHGRRIPSKASTMYLLVFTFNTCRLPVNHSTLFCISSSCIEICISIEKHKQMCMLRNSNVH